MMNLILLFETLIEDNQIFLFFKMLFLEGKKQVYQYKFTVFSTFNERYRKQRL